MDFNIFYSLGVGIFVIYAYAMIELVTRKKKEKTKPKEDKDSKEITQDDYEKMLSTLMAYNVITVQEYNNLLVKGLPYFK